MYYTVYTIFQSKRTLRRRAANKLDELINEVGTTNAFENDPETTSAISSCEQKNVYCVEAGATYDDYSEHGGASNDLHHHLTEEFTGKFTAMVNQNT